MHMLFTLSLLVSIALAQKSRLMQHCTKPNTVAITLDDGPYIYQKQISDLATQNGAKLTFFVNGNNYRCIYDLADDLKYTYSQGHQISSHTWSHKNLSSLSQDQVHDEMWKLENALNKIIGVQPAQMRPPYGSFDEDVLHVSSKRNQSVIMWDFDSRDAKGRTPVDSNEAYDIAIAAHPKTLLALNHETYETTLNEVLPHAIKKFKESGYDMVTVAECIGEEAYRWTRPAGTRDDSWHC